MVRRRAILPVLALSLFAVQAAAAQTATVKDLSGRSVVIPAPARRILIDDGRYLVALSLIHPNPPSVIAGWPRDINRVASSEWPPSAKKLSRIPTRSRLSTA